MSKVLLDELVEIHGRVGWKGYTVEDLTDTGPLVLGANEITSDNQLDLSGAKHLTREKYEESPEIFVKKDDILVVKVGSTIGKVGIVNKELGEASINPNCVIVRATKINPYYLYYYMCSPAGRAFLINNSAASGQPALNQATLRKMEIPVIDVVKQEQIAVLLNQINDKISNNTAICADLEAMAKLLYDYWFVQFDFPDENGKPYKSSGGKMVWNEELKREIPEGWEAGTISDLGDVIGGATPSTKNNEYYVDNGIGWITPNDLSNNSNKYISHGERDITKEAVASCSTTIMPRGTVLMSSRAPIGYLAIASDSLCTNQGFKSIVPKGYSSEYIYQTLAVMMPYIKNFGVGSTFAEVSKDELSNMKILLPDKSIEQQYAERTKCIGKQIELLEKENQQFNSLRDFLLPMLMNGQVKVGKEG